MRRQTPTNSGEAVVWTGTRRKEARGQKRHNLKSSLETIMKHDYFNAADFAYDVDDGWLVLWDHDGNEILSIAYEVVEVI